MIQEKNDTAAMAAQSLFSAIAGASFGFAEPPLPDGLVPGLEVGEAPLPVCSEEPLPLTMAVSSSENARI